MNETKSAYAIELKDVHKEYIVESQNIRALNGVDLKVKRGSVVAIVGQSGSGKSTLLHVVGTLDRPSRGQVVLGGTDVSEMSDAAASQFRNCTVGFVFQMNNLLPEFSAIENVMMPGLISGHKREKIRERAAQLLGAVGLSRRESHRPGEMSGGEQQRVAIARALLMAPPVLLADEPTGNLDHKTSSAVRDLLLELCLNHGMTMLLVTHDMELASCLPMQLVLQDGQVLQKEGF
jgi:lipoprotein-releasing system ATP-binding protein